MKSKVKSQKSKVRKDYYLVLDPGASDGALRFYFFDKEGKKSGEHTFQKNSKSIEKLLATVEARALRLRVRMSDLRGVIIVRGGESFSTVRGAYAIANALSWSLDIPAMKVDISMYQKEKMSIITALKRRKKFSLLIPEYQRAPNITV